MLILLPILYANADMNEIKSLPGGNHITDQMFLAIIRGQNGDLFGRVTNQPHVHKSGHHEFGLGQILIEKGAGRRFADSIEILNIDQLEVVAKSSVGLQVARGIEDMAEIAQAFVTPIVQAANTGSGTALSVQIHGGYT